MRNIERAANMGLATAQAALGMIYFTGIGVPRDPPSGNQMVLTSSPAKASFSYVLSWNGLFHGVMVLK